MDAAIYEVGTSSLVVVFDFQKETTIMYRCEMDALFLKENKKHKPCSKNNKMHACGHDVHMAMMLALAEYIQNNQNNHNVVMVFEEAEEMDGNAEEILSFLTTLPYEIKYCICMHVWPNLNFGELYSNPTNLMAKSHEIEITIEGKASHISSANKENDALLAGVELINEINKYYEYSMPLMTRYRFGTFNSGTALNVVSSKSVIKGSCRTYNPQELVKFQQKVRLIIENIDMKYKTYTNMKYSKGYQIIRNTPTVYHQLAKLIPIKYIDPLYTCDSAGSYLNKYHGCYLLLGAGDIAPLHSSDFQVNEELLSIGLNYLIKTLSL